MFEDGVRLDDIINVLKPPTLDEDDDKKKQPIPDAAIRYEIKKSVGVDSVKFEFARNSEALR